MDERGTVQELTEALATDKPKLTSAEVAKRLRGVSREAAGLYAYYVDRERSKQPAVSRNRAAKDLHVQAWQVRAWQLELVTAGLLDGPQAKPPTVEEELAAARARIEELESLLAAACESEVAR